MMSNYTVHATRTKTEHPKLVNMSQVKSSSSRTSESVESFFFQEKPSFQWQRPYTTAQGEVIICPALTSTIKYALISSIYRELSNLMPEIGHLYIRPLIAAKCGWCSLKCVPECIMCRHTWSTEASVWCYFTSMLHTFLYIYSKNSKIAMFLKVNEQLISLIWWHILSFGKWPWYKGKNDFVFAFASSSPIMQHMLNYFSLRDTILVQHCTTVSCETGVQIQHINWINVLFKEYLRQQVVTTSPNLQQHNLLREGGQMN